MSNIRQYALGQHYLDVVVCDVAHNPWRVPLGGMFDAIVTDPPYGVRAGAKKIGKEIDVEIQDRTKRVPQKGRRRAGCYVALDSANL